MKYYVYYLDVHFVQHYESHVLRIFRTVQYLSNIPITPYTLHTTLLHILKVCRSVKMNTKAQYMNLIEPSLLQ
jgi:hypothetical protein